ncbi:MAG: glycosyl hydrolase, partial [Alloacidobacterium sp.]
MSPATCYEKSLLFEKKKLPMAGATASAGIFSIAMNADKTIAVAVGGDYTKPNESNGTAAWTADGGQHWTAAEKPPHGYRSAVAWDADSKAWIAAGTNGSDISYDDGKTWQPLDDGNWNALSLPWIVGPKGRIAKLGALPKK